MKLVECGNCADFEKPILKNPNRIEPGECKSFEKGKTKATPKQIERAYFIRGNCEFLYCTLRHCDKFKEINNDTTV